ncbi:MAG: hypothetical protein ACR2PQ_10525, partial [Myxococcota bacterium]
MVARLSRSILAPVAIVALLFGGALAVAEDESAPVPSATGTPQEPASPGQPWSVPAEGSCNPQGGPVGLTVREDDSGVPFETGDAFEMDRLNVLRNYLPEFLWQERERFFYEGMRLEIGPCFRDYSAPDFYQQATAAGAGKARLDENRGLVDYGAGMPFAPDSI